MIEFKPLTIEAMPLLRHYFKHRKNRLCDNTPGVALMWRDTYKTAYATDGNCLYFKVDYPKIGSVFTLPICGCRTAYFKNIMEYCKETGNPLSFCAVDKDELAEIREKFPNVTATANRDTFDYLYDAEGLKYFKGKKLSGQRNHVNKFIKTYENWEFRVVEDSHIPLLQEFLQRYAQLVDKNSTTFHEELSKTFEVLENMTAYGMIGGVLLVDGAVAGFALGEALGDTLFTHIEKADRAYQGAYQMLVSQFAQKFAVGEVIYTNREDDTGDLGLRTSKLAYQPIELMEKYSVIISEPYGTEPVVY